MRSKACVILMLLSGSALYLQGQSSSRSDWPDEKPSVRRFSLGATATFLGPGFIKGKTTNVTTAIPAVNTTYTVADVAHRFGYGVLAQLALTGRFAVNASLLLRRGAYTLKNDTYLGTDNPETLEDERTHVVKNESTNLKMVDLPVTLRFYGKDRFVPGPRWFVEGGGIVRRAFQVRSSTNTTIDAGTTSCCDTTPAATRRTVRGFVVGAGFQVNDPIGIRIVPGVRYTRWMDSTFESPAAPRRDQVEGMISLTF